MGYREFFNDGSCHHGRCQKIVWSKPGDGAVFQKIVWSKPGDGAVFRGSGEQIGREDEAPSAVFGFAGWEEKSRLDEMKHDGYEKGGVCSVIAIKFRLEIHQFIAFYRWFANPLPCLIVCLSVTVAAFVVVDVVVAGLVPWDDIFVPTSVMISLIQGPSHRRVRWWLVIRTISLHRMPCLRQSHDWFPVTLPSALHPSVMLPPYPNDRDWRVVIDKESRRNITSVSNSRSNFHWKIIFRMCRTPNNKRQTPTYLDDSLAGGNSHCGSV